MRILSLGAGFVADHLPYDKITERVFLDYKSVDNILSRWKPDVLINCIGKTGRPNVDWCESHKEETYGANVTLPLLLADYCVRNKVHLIQLGSGCVYFGESPTTQWIIPQWKANMDAVKVDFGWKETDFANPKSYYSKTKYACDLILGEMPHVTTLRLRMPISELDTPRNFINKIRGYNQVIDVPNSVTFMTDLARCVAWAADNRPGGIFHVTNPAPLSAAQVMREFQKYVPEHQFEVITEHQLDQLTIAKRSNCILSTDKLRLAGFQMTDSEEALTQCMSNYIKNMQRRENV